MRCLLMYLKDEEMVQLRDHFSQVYNLRELFLEKA